MCITFLFCEKLRYNILLFRINHTIILDDPFDDPVGLVFPDKSPEPTKEQLQVTKILNLTIVY